MKKTILFTVLIAILLSLVACSPISNEDMDEKVNEYITALINGDGDVLKSLSHPDCVDDIDEFLEEVKSSLELSGEITKLKAYSRETAYYNSKYKGSINKSKYNLELDEIKYNVEVLYLKNDDGTGFSEFSIKQK